MVSKTHSSDPYHAKYPVSDRTGHEWAAPAHVSAKDKAYTSALMQAVGEIVWVKKSQINGIIAAAGSAPAYFYFMEAMQTKAFAKVSPEMAALVNKLHWRKSCGQS